jgi:hypothetical protein
MQLQILRQRLRFCRKNAPVMVFGGIGVLILAGVLFFVVPASVLSAVFSIVFGIAGFVSIGRGIGLYFEQGRLRRQIPELERRLEEDRASDR